MFILNYLVNIMFIEKLLLYCFFNVSFIEAEIVASNQKIEIGCEIREGIIDTIIS